MAFENAAVYSEVMKLSASNNTDVTFRLEAEFIIDNRIYPTQQVVAQQLLRDYVDNYADVNMLIVSVDPSFYINVLVPAKHKLKLRLTRVRTTSNAVTTDMADRRAWTYDAYMTDVIDTDVRSDSRLSASGNTEGMTDQVDVTLQLTEARLTELRQVEVGGVYAGVSVEDVSRYLMLHGRDDALPGQVLTAEDFDGIRGMDIHPPNNQRTYSHIVIPMGTRLSRLPQFLQEQYGIYSSGAGYYCQDGLWYMYPLLDYTRFNPNVSTLTIMNVPEDEMVSPDRSYLLRARQLFVFATGKTEYNDRSDATQVNEGNAYSFYNASNLMDGMVTKTTNRAIPNNGQTQKTLALESRASGVQGVKMAEGRFTANPFKDVSRLSAGLGTPMTVIWENADPSLLYPGMPTKVLYMKNGEVKALQGTLLGVNINSAPSTDSVIDQAFSSTCVLKIFVTRTTA